MKAMVLLIGTLLLVGTAGCCESGEPAHAEHRGGAYDGDYHHDYGHDSRDYPDYEHYPYSR